ncbi:MAG TPA: hypothetical protein VFW91_06800, partial [Candidatus Binatia bacterium]|nr:hypothetical protein [Candidatus Binatia bacterium]
RDAPFPASGPRGSQPNAQPGVKDRQSVFSNQPDGNAAKKVRAAFPILAEACKLGSIPCSRHQRKAHSPLVDSHHSFTRAEIGPVIVVSLISALRLLGIFFMLPIFSAYAVRYPGATIGLGGLRSEFTLSRNVSSRFRWAGPVTAGDASRF